jgi:hypothetical protein
MALFYAPDDVGPAAVEAEALRVRIVALETTLWRDGTLATARTQKGLQVGASAVTGVSAAVISGQLADANLPSVISAGRIGAGYAASNLAGSLAQAQMQDNVAAAVNAGSGTIDGAKVGSGYAAPGLVGDVAQGRMQTNAAGAINAGTSTVSANKVGSGYPLDATTGNLTQSRIDWSSVSGSRTPEDDYLPITVSGMTRYIRLYS